MKIALYIARKLVRMVSLLICVSVVAFALVSISPIDPVQANVGQAAMGAMSEEQIAKLRAYWGEGEPPVRRFLAWAEDFVRGDMGTSLLYRRDVSAILRERLTNSLGLLLFSWLLSGLLGYALGILAGAAQGRALDKCVRAYALVTASTPAFWLALILLMVFAVWLGVLPIALSVPIGTAAADVTLWDRVRHAILPALALSITGTASVALHTRQKLIDALETDWALFARARGDSTWRVVRRHGLRATLLPAMTLQFASIGEIIGGSVLVEQVFSYPGLGQAAVSAGLGGDVPLLLGITVVSAAVVFGGNFLADVLYGVIDPRMRGGEARA